MATFSQQTLTRWRRNPISFIQQCLRDPETGKPFTLLDAERRFLAHAFQLGDDRRLLYPEQVYSCLKKSGKTTFAAIHALTTTLLFGGGYPEATICANDLDQARGRVFEMMKRIVECSPLLLAEARITQARIEFLGLKATIQAIGFDYAGAAGGNQCIAVFDELWAYSTERSHRLWDELVPPPTRKIACRLTVTYAGFAGESTVLEALYQRGLQQPLVAKDLHAGDGILMFWSHDPIAPWQTEAWRAEMRRSMRPNAYLRMIENRFVTTESTFIDMAWWDDCVDPHATRIITDRKLSVWIGVDTSVKRDSTAIVAVHWDQKGQKARLVWHRIYQPLPDQPIDFEVAIENTIRDLHKRYRVRGVWYDPYQMQASAQRLRREGVRIEGFPQSASNLTEASQNLYELIKGGNFVTYSDAAVRLAVSRAVAVETARGWRIAKDKQSHKIDVVVALAMAALAAGGREYVQLGMGQRLWRRGARAIHRAPAAAVGRNAADLQRMRQKGEPDATTASRWVSILDEQGKLRRRVAHDRDVVCVPLDRGSRGRFALIQQGRQTLRRLASSFMLSTRHQSRRRGREFAWLSHHQGKQAHEIDVVSRSVAALAAVKAQSEHTY